MDVSTWTPHAQTAVIILLLLGRWIERREAKERVTTKELVVVTAASNVTAEAECDSVLTARVIQMADEVGALRTVAQAAQQEKVHPRAPMPAPATRCYQSG